MELKGAQFLTSRIDHFFENSIRGKIIFSSFGDMTDSTNLVRLIKGIQPNEIYNLAAMSQ